MLFTFCQTGLIAGSRIGEGRAPEETDKADLLQQELLCWRVMQYETKSSTLKLDRGVDLRRGCRAVAAASRSGVHDNIMVIRCLTSILALVTTAGTILCYEGQLSDVGSTIRNADCPGYFCAKTEQPLESDDQPPSVYYGCGEPFCDGEGCSRRNNVTLCCCSNDFCNKKESDDPTASVVGSRSRLLAGLSWFLAISLVIQPFIVGTAIL
ncbi:hypothetical protein Q1695_005326 [Nippostrongylus brasiliensis]|nr:hypothetical protein Q1695_005326 [Nippostrongylus brasiliensis]